MEGIPETRTQQTKEKTTMDTPAAERKIIKNRIRQGDFAPLLAAWSYVQIADRLLRNNNRDPALLEGIPKHLGHTTWKQFLADGNWDLTTVPNDRIAWFAERIRNQAKKVLSRESLDFEEDEMPDIGPLYRDP
ncbi:MAG: hypothetical protein SNJ85_07880 [Cyanobacteriota bacterium]